MKNIALSAFILAMLLTSCGKDETTKVQKKDIIDAVFASGYVAFDDEYAVTANTEGFILQSHIKEGDSVKKGATLFQLSNDVQALQALNANTNYQEALSNANDNAPKIQQLVSQIAQAKMAMALDKKNYEMYDEGINQPKIAQVNQQLMQAKQSLDLDKKNYERYENLLKTNAVAKVEYDKVKLQYENSQHNVAILEKNLAEKSTLTKMDLDKARLQYENSQTNVAILEKSLADMKRNLNLGVKNSKNQVEIQQQYTGDYSLFSTLTGTVLTIQKQTGELARKGEVLAKIGGGALVTKLYIAEEDINKIKLGQKVMLNLNTEKNKPYEAVVAKIYPAFNEKEQSFIIEVTFTEELPNLRSGTQVQANIIIEERKEVLVIPKKYLLKEDKVQLENKEEKAVKIGMRSGEWVEILDGVDFNTTIVLPKSK